VGDWKPLHRSDNGHGAWGVRAGVDGSIPLFHSAAPSLPICLPLPDM
jgi:hypothetical protein